MMKGAPLMGAAFLALALLWPATVHAASPPSADPCLSFLSSGFTNGSAVDTGVRPASATKAAGQAATLSLLLGVRLALGPAEDLNGKVMRVADAPDISALDIQRYRTCKKEQALRVSYLP